ncbi:MAG: zinc-binding dehydrogenase [Kiritimatiellia bacterium]|jgi:threonine dehydrogenase-like Zn-dependent dehydrogenase
MNTTTSIPETMLAVRLHGRGFESIKVETVPVPQPGPGQLLARVEAAGVCSSILKLLAQGEAHTFINGWDLAKFPVTLGDEGCVTIVKAGRDVADKYPVGRRYATQPAVDHPPINHRERYRNAAEGMHKVAVGYTLPGHLSQYMLITEETLAADCLVPLPDDSIPFFAGALCEPLSCVISAQDRHIHIAQETPLSARKPRLGLLPGGVALVIGAGPMGRLHAEAALRYRPAHLVVTDIAPGRLDWIKRNLAKKAQRAGTQLHAVPAAEGPALVRELSGGRGADDIIAAVGVRQVQAESQQWLAHGGVLNLFGGLKRGEHLIELDTLRVHYDEIRLCGSSGGSPADVAEALRMVAAGEIDPGAHLDMVGSLDCFPEALKAVNDAVVEGKVVLYPHVRQTPLAKVSGWRKQDEEKFLAAHGM